MFQAFRNKQLCAPAGWELYAGLGCWLVWQFLLAVLLAPLPGWFDLPPDSKQANLLIQLSYFSISFVMVAAVFWKLLHRSMRHLRGRGFCLLKTLLRGFALYFALLYAVALLILALPAQPDNRNNAAIGSLFADAPIPMAIATVLFAPVTEEVLVRGMIFAPLCKKSPLLAYAVSVVIFGGLHVIAYLGQQPPLTLLISFVQYLPASIALGWTYQSTGSLCAPILLHAAINGYAMLMLF